MNRLQRLESGGAWVPSITVFKGGRNRRVNVEKTAEHVLNLARNGAQGVVVNGTTGEGHNLEHVDKLALITAIGRLKAGGRLGKEFVLITGTGTQDVQKAREIISAARENGFDGVLALPLKSGTEEQKASFYSELAQACDHRSPGMRLGLILYHIPRPPMGYSINPGMLADLMKEHRTVVGVKDSSGDAALLGQWVPVVHQATGRTPLLAVGEDFFIHRGLREAGAKAAIAGAANTPRGLGAMLDVFRHHDAGEHELAQAAQARMDDEVRLLLESGGRPFRENAKRRRVR